MDNPNYKLTFMLDSAAMITVHTPKRGVVEVCELVSVSISILQLHTNGTSLLRQKSYFQ